jgi:hypothetical protein
MLTESPFQVPNNLFSFVCSLSLVATQVVLPVVGEVLDKFSFVTGESEEMGLVVVVVVMVGSMVSCPSGSAEPDLAAAVF